MRDTTYAAAGAEAAVAAEIRALARPLVLASDLDPLVHALAPTRFACLGEASHGTHEYYAWRATLTRRLIEEQGFTWIGVEGDWPDCWRINRWVRGFDDQRRGAEEVLRHFERWPTWMWANREVARFLDWLHEWNLARPVEQRVGFYGLDVYSLWDSLRVILGWLERHRPEAVPAAHLAWQCFVPYREDPHLYARATRLVPTSCEDEVVRLLAETRHRAGGVPADEHEFNLLQNVEVAAGAEEYYRTMVRGDRESWNVRDRHMVATIGRLAAHLGPDAKGVVWEHNTHVGDARATDMVSAGMVNVGQLLRERYAGDGVGLVGFAAHRGTVLAASAWGDREESFTLPQARPGSHEDVLHRALGRPALLVFAGASGRWLEEVRGHRAVGVVYDPDREGGNYVPTVMGGRYDALLWFEETRALHPLAHEGRSRGPEMETEPSGL